MFDLLSFGETWRLKREQEQADKPLYNWEIGIENYNLVSRMQLKFSYQNLEPMNLPHRHLANTHTHRDTESGYVKQTKGW